MPLTQILSYPCQTNIINTQSIKSFLTNPDFQRAHYTIILIFLFPFAPLLLDPFLSQTKEPLDQLDNPLSLVLALLFFDKKRGFLNFFDFELFQRNGVSS